MILLLQFRNLFVLHTTAFLINFSSNISVGSPLLLPVLILLLQMEIFRKLNIHFMLQKNDDFVTEFYLKRLWSWVFVNRNKLKINLFISIEMGTTCIHVFPYLKKLLLTKSSRCLG